MTEVNTINKCQQFKNKVNFLTKTSEIPTKQITNLDNAYDHRPYRPILLRVRHIECFSRE